LLQTYTFLMVFVTVIYLKISIFLFGLSTVVFQVCVCVYIYIVGLRVNRNCILSKLELLICLTKSWRVFMLEVNL